MRLPDGTGLSSLRDEAAKASSPKASIPSAGGFVQWNGGICPVHVDTYVDYRLRWFKPADRTYRATAGHCRWDHGRTPESAALTNPDRHSDIVEYRISADQE